MRFMILRKADARTEAGVLPTEDDFAVMGKYVEELNAAGVLLDAEGLQSSSKGAKVRFSGGRTTVIDGPFAEAKELIAGYITIQVKSLEEAIEWARRWPPSDANDGELELEVRRIYEATDFDESFTPELQEREEQVRTEAAKRR